MRAKQDVKNGKLWYWYHRWISEILSDLWSVAMVGIGSTTGLIGVVSVPSYFVFRLNADDPHPPPWIRVRLSIAFGAALFADPQWDRLKNLWDKLYPLTLAGDAKQRVYQRLENIIPDLVNLVLSHRPNSLRGRKLRDVFPLHDRQPQKLRVLFKNWERSKVLRDKARPSLIFAMIGQARADNRITPKEENLMLSKMLRKWAVQRTIY